MTLKIIGIGLISTYLGSFYPLNANATDPILPGDAQDHSVESETGIMSGNNDSDPEFYQDFSITSGTGKGERNFVICAEAEKTFLENLYHMICFYSTGS